MKEILMSAHYGWGITGRSLREDIRYWALQARRARRVTTGLRELLLANARRSSLRLRALYRSAIHGDSAMLDAEIQRVIHAK